MPHEFDGQAYKKASTHQKEWGNRIIGEFNFRGNEHILDLGCGDGALTAQLAELVPEGRVLGIDSSKGMLEVAREHQSINLEFRLQDINTLEFEEEFDLIFSNATLHWIKDHDRLLQYAFKSLKKGGHIRFNFGSEGNCIHFLRVIREAMKMPQYAVYFLKFEWPWYMPSVTEYEALVRRVPFREIKVWGENADRFFSDRQALVNWVEQPSLVPFIAAVHQAEKEGFRKWVTEKMVEETLQADGRCFETFRRINVLARK